MSGCVCVFVYTCVCEHMHMCVCMLVLHMFVSKFVFCSLYCQDFFWHLSRLVLFKFGVLKTV